MVTPYRRMTQLLYELHNLLLQIYFYSSETVQNPTVHVTFALRAWGNKGFNGYQAMFTVNTKNDQTSLPNTKDWCPFTNSIEKLFQKITPQTVTV